MTHDEMIEAVAKAICEADKPNYEKRERWPIIGTVLQAQFKGIARAAIRVIAPAVEQETVAKIVAWLRDNSTPHNDIDEWADEIEAKWGKQ